MPLTRNCSAGPTAEVEATAAIEAWFRETVPRDFATSLDEDEAALTVQEGALCALLDYRIQRKKLGTLAD